MKTAIILEEFSASSSGAVQVTLANPPASLKPSPRRTSDGVRCFAVGQVKRAEKFREMLRRRETAPFESAIPYQHWGINE